MCRADLAVRVQGGPYGCVMSEGGPLSGGLSEHGRGGEGGVVVQTTQLVRTQHSTLTPTHLHTQRSTGAGLSLGSCTRAQETITPQQASGFKASSIWPYREGLCGGLAP